MFNFPGGRGRDHRVSTDRRLARGPVTIGFEQLETRETLSTGLALTIIPSRVPPLASMPRPIVGSVNPEADADGWVAGPGPIRVTMEPEPEWRWTRPRSIGGRFRMGGEGLE